MLKLLPIIVTVYGLIANSGYFTQSYAIYKNKSSNNVSILTFVLYLISTALWVIYGMAINSLPVVLTNGMAVIGALLVVILYFKYKKISQ